MRVIRTLLAISCMMTLVLPSVAYTQQAYLKPGAAFPNSVTVPGLVTVTATERKAPPAWALMERHLIDTMNHAAPEFLAKYADRGGKMPLIGKPDDMYEVFLNWPLFYALGGSEEILDLSIRQWNAITRELTYTVKRLDREFVVHYDWFHNAESYKYFYYFGLADPQIPENLDRAERFAMMFTGEDSLAPNYDPVHRIMRSPSTGSTGPSFEQNCVYALNYGHASLYPLVKEAFVPGWEKDPLKYDEIQKLYNKVVISGDTPVSLNACALVANAYLYTSDEKYRAWIVGYVDAWMERIRENNGIIPDNIGPTGKIGENRNGQWWGGFFGWNARYSIHMIFGALTSAAETAYLVTGDPKYLDLLRSQIDVLLNNSRTEKGQLLVPYKYGQDGWFDYRPYEARELGHLWNMSMDPGDRARIDRLLKGSKYGPNPYDNYNDFKLTVTGDRTFQWKPDGTLRDYTAAVPTGDIGDERQEQEELNEAPRLLFLAGKNPGFPEKILTANYTELLRRIEESRSIVDIYKVPGLISEELAGLNPVVTKGLVFLTLGSPQAIYNGGLLQARVRYFDPDRARPGLPEDVAALIDTLDAVRTVLTLVNLNAFETRLVIVQGGAYGEHEFTGVRYREASRDNGGNTVYTDRSVPVGKKYFAVVLPPSSSIRLDMGMRRFANRPSYAFPWH